MPVIKKRLQIQTTMGVGLDRSVSFVVGDVPKIEVARLRGAVFEVSTKLEAIKVFNELKVVAHTAVVEGAVPAFLDALGQRTGSSSDLGPRFDAFADEWLETNVRGGGLRESQVRSDESIVKLHLKPEFARRHIREITVRDVDRFKAKKRGQVHQYGTGYSASSINNQLSVLHRILEKAEEYGVLEKNPVTKRSWMKPDATSEDAREWWSPDEERKAFAVLLGPWKETRPLERIVLLTQLTTGIRFSEIRALEKRDLDFQTPAIQVRRSRARTEVSTPKNKKARGQVIPPELAEELRQWMLRQEGQLLFPSKRGGPLPNNSLNRWYAKLSDDAGVPRITSHGARHTAGSSYAYLGAGQKMIGTLLGHTDLSATQRYTHVRVEGTKELVNARWAGLCQSSDG